MLRRLVIRFVLPVVLLGFAGLVPVAGVAQAAPALPPPAAAPSVTATGSGYGSVTPARLLDTRSPWGETVDGIAQEQGKLGAGATVTFPVRGRGGIPSTGVGAVVLNVTATSNWDPTYLSVHPAGEPIPQPPTSNLNVAGRTVANLVITKVGDDGQVTVRNAFGAVDVIADVMGWFPARGAFTGHNAARLLDTRSGAPTVDGQASGGGPISGGSVRSVPLLGRGPVPPSGIGAVVLNVTSTDADVGSYLSVQPGGSPVPAAPTSNVNVEPGRVVPNLVVAKVGADGRVDIRNAAGSVHVVADVMGWFPTGEAYSGLTPTRLLDTRDAPGLNTVDGQSRGVGQLDSGATLSVPVLGRGGVPTTGVGAVVVNVTGTNPTSRTYLAVTPNGSRPPTVPTSNLNVEWPFTAANLVIAEVGVDGLINIASVGSGVDVIVDVMGWLPGTPAAPADAPRLTGATKVAAGDRHSCAIVTGGTVRCWGSNQFGMLGDGTTDNRYAPVDVVGVAGATQLTAGSMHTCAIVTDGQVRCWGNDFFGQLGDGEIDQDPGPGLSTVDGIAGATAISAGSTHTCAVVVGGEVRCWGMNDDGEVASGNRWAWQPRPVTVPGITGATAVTSGTDHSCAVLPGGTVRCWGSNKQGQLGNGLIAEWSMPVQAVGLSGATAIDAGSWHTCVLAGGGVACWGRNDEGQLGDGTTTDRLTAMPVRRSSGATAVGGGFGHTCMLVAGGQARCWGDNSSYAELGDDSVVNLRTAPVGVVGAAGATDLSVGTSHSCIVVAGGELRCWGTDADFRTGRPIAGGGRTALPVTTDFWWTPSDPDAG